MALTRKKSRGQHTRTPSSYFVFWGDTVLIDLNREHGGLAVIAVMAFSSRRLLCAKQVPRASSLISLSPVCSRVIPGTQPSPQTSLWTGLATAEHQRLVASLTGNRGGGRLALCHLCDGVKCTPVSSSCPWEAARQHSAYSLLSFSLCTLGLSFI